MLFLHHTFAVELIVRDQQIGQNFAAEDGLVDDARDIFQLDSAVPDGLRINDDGRTEFALVQTACIVCSHGCVQAPPLNFRLEKIPQRIRTVGVATASRTVRRALVAAYKNMVREFWHS